MALLRTLDRLTALVTGTVDANACIAQHQCCCKAGTTRALDCYGNCVSQPYCYKAPSHPNCAG
jgi:hypothetical protein